MDCAHPAGSCACARERERRRPEESTLYKTVAAGLPGFLEQREAQGRAVPSFVKRALQGYLKCGLLQPGFCQYLLRPPISDDRLTVLPDGRVSLTLKTPWRDGLVACLAA